MSLDLPNVINRPFKVTYSSGRCQYVNERFAKLMLGKVCPYGCCRPGRVYLDLEGDEWEHTQLEPIDG